MIIVINQEARIFKQKLIDSKKSGLVLDIDETLSYTISYWVTEMQKLFGNPENLSVQDLIAKYRYTQNIPYWQTPEALKWMEKSRENNALQEQLPLIKNSNHFVEKINNIIPIVGYITIRPRNVIPGTINWLRKHNFPNVDILARPINIPSSEGNQWKAEILHFLYPQVCGIIDDSQSVAEKLDKNYQGVVFLYNNSETVRNDINVIPCRTWKNVYYSIKSFHSDK